jgi:hypothetical protein
LSVSYRRKDLHGGIGRQLGLRFAATQLVQITLAYKSLRLKDALPKYRNSSYCVGSTLPGVTTAYILLKHKIAVHK